MKNLDVLITGAGLVHTMKGPVPRRREGMLNTGAVRSADIGIVGDKIVFVGDIKTDGAGFTVGSNTHVIDAKGADVIPGFVDSHTHLVWAGDRRGEFADLLRGKTYEQITAEGGGINTTVRATRRASFDTLVESGLDRSLRMLAYGTTTIEAKSGYALDTEGELRTLAATHHLRSLTPQHFFLTFLGAHLVPFDYKDRRDDYVKLLTDVMIPRVAEQGYAQFCDVFMEHNAFNADETRRIVNSAKEHGLKPRIHADEFTDMGGGALAVSLGAASCDHLERISQSSIEAIAASDTVATLMPGTSFYLNLPSHAPFKKLYDANCAIALATDFNPGSSPSLSMQGAFALGVLALRMPVEAALTASTINAAYSLGADGQVGSIEAGKRADIVILRSSIVDIAYHWGENSAAYVFCAGKCVAKGGIVDLQNSSTR